MYEETLPIGTVVSLKEQEGRMYMIAGLRAGMESGKVYDYLGTIYPIGVTGAQSYICFNKVLIDQVFFRGYEGPHWQKLKEKLNMLDTEIV